MSSENSQEFETVSKTAVTPSSTSISSVSSVTSMMSMITNKFSIHLIAEIIIYVSTTYYFYKKIRDLEKTVEILSKKLENYDKTIEEEIKKLNDSTSLSSIQPHIKQQLQYEMTSIKKTLPLEIKMEVTQNLQDIVRQQSNEYVQQYAQQYVQRYVQQYTQQYAQQYTQQYAQQYTQQYTQQYSQQYTQEYTQNPEEKNHPKVESSPIQQSQTPPPTPKIMPLREKNEKIDKKSEFMTPMMIISDFIPISVPKKSSAIIEEVEEKEPEDEEDLDNLDKELQEEYRELEKGNLED